MTQKTISTIEDLNLIAGEKLVKHPDSDTLYLRIRPLTIATYEVFKEVSESEKDGDEIEAMLELLALSIVNEDGERFLTSAVIRDNFSIGAVIELANKAMDISGISKESLNEDEFEKK